MAVGKQDETIIVKWFPGESTGHDGSGITVVNPPVDSITTVSGGYAFLDARIDTEQARVTTLSTRIVASGVLPTGV